MALKLKTAPTEAPVTLDQVKQHLRVDHNDEDTLIATYIAAAVSYLDGLSGILGRAMVNQTWELYYDAFPCGPLQIPLGPLLSVSTVEYADAAGTYQTWEATNYTVDTASDPGWVVPVDSWPAPLATANAVKVTFVAGFGDATKVPAALKAALLLLIGDMYEQRENTIVGQSVETMPIACLALIAPFRRCVV